MADLGGDADLDILSRPYNLQTRRIDVWPNQAREKRYGFKLWNMAAQGEWWPV